MNTTKVWRTFESNSMESLQHAALLRLVHSLFCHRPQRQCMVCSACNSPSLDSWNQHVTLIPVKAVVDIQSQILQICWREVQIEWLGLFSTELLLQVPTHSGIALVWTEGDPVYNYIHKAIWLNRSRYAMLTLTLGSPRAKQIEAIGLSKVMSLRALRTMRRQAFSMLAANLNWRFYRSVQG